MQQVPHENINYCTSMSLSVWRSLGLYGLLYPRDGGANLSQTLVAETPVAPNVKVTLLVQAAEQLRRWIITRGLCPFVAHLVLFKVSFTHVCALAASLLSSQNCNKQKNYILIYLPKTSNYKIVSWCFSRVIGHQDRITKVAAMHMVTLTSSYERNSGL